MSGYKGDKGYGRSDDEIFVDKDGIPHFNAQKIELLKEYRRRVEMEYEASYAEQRPCTCTSTRLCLSACGSLAFFNTYGSFFRPQVWLIFDMFLSIEIENLMLESFGQAPRGPKT